MDGALHGRFVWQMLLILGIAKIVATLLCFGAGTPGGMFAPTLFIGAMIGGGVAGLMRLYWPFPMSAVDSYVLAGMGTFFAGVFRAPMTSIFMVFELSASYVIILPVMISNTLAYFVSRALQPVPFFTMLARDEGVDLPSAEEYRNVSLLRVEDAMQPPVEGVATTGPRLYPDLPLDTAMRLLGTHPVLPVASRAEPSSVIGMVTLADIHRAYGISRPPAAAGTLTQATRPQ
jgi:CIC family chloride channel protein